MASLDEIGRLRRVTDLAEDDTTYTDSVLGGMIDDLTFDVAAAQVWQEKAAAYASMVDVTESGSTRRFSGLVDNALKMSARLQPDPADETRGRSFTVGIERA